MPLIWNIVINWLKSYKPNKNFTVVSYKRRKKKTTYTSELLAGFSLRPSITVLSMYINRICYYFLCELFWSSCVQPSVWLSHQYNSLGFQTSQSVKFLLLRLIPLFSFWKSEHIRPSNKSILHTVFPSYSVFSITAQNNSQPLQHIISTEILHVNS